MGFKRILNNIFKRNKNNYAFENNTEYNYEERNSNNHLDNSFNTTVTQTYPDKPEHTHIINSINLNDLPQRKISFVNIDAAELNNKGKSKFVYNSKELFVEEVALEYYIQNGNIAIWSENHYWWFIYALLFWDIIFMKTDTFTQVPMHHPDFNKQYEFALQFNGMPHDFFKESFYQVRVNEIEKRINELKHTNLNEEIERSYLEHYDMLCRPIENWDKFTLNQLLLSSQNLENVQLLSIMEHLIRNFSDNRSGLPDLTIIDKNNNLFFAEVKSKKDNLSNNQIKWHEYLVQNAKIPVEIFTVNKTHRQLNNLYSKYNPNLLNIKTKINNKESKDNKDVSSIPHDRLIEIEYKEFSNSSKEIKASDKYLDVVIALNNKAKSLEKSKPDEAISIYEKVINEYKFSGNYPYDRLIILYRKDKRYEDIIRVCDTAIVNLKYNGYIIGNKIMFKEHIRADAVRKTEKFKQTRKDTEYLLKNKKITDRIKEGQEFEKQKELDKAICIYEEVIATNYPKKLPYQRLCIVYRKKKDYEKELDICDRAIQILNEHEAKWFEERKIKVLEKLKVIK